MAVVTRPVIVTALFRGHNAVGGDNIVGVLAALVRWASAVNPVAVTVIACVLACPATKPKARPPGEVVTAPEAGVVLVADVPVATSTGDPVATPANSSTLMAITAADEVRAVTVVANRAFAAYQSSPSE